MIKVESLKLFTSVVISVKSFITTLENLIIFPFRCDLFLSLFDAQTVRLHSTVSVC